MSTPVVQHGHAGAWHDAHRLAIGSLATVAAFVVWMLLLMPVGWALQAALDLDDTQLLFEAGGWGWVAYVAMVTAAALPPAVGIVLGLRARRLGERRLGTAGVLANGLVASLYVLGPALAALIG